MNSLFPVSKVKHSVQFTNMSIHNHLSVVVSNKCNSNVMITILTIRWQHKRIFTKKTDKIHIIPNSYVDCHFQGVSTLPLCSFTNVVMTIHHKILKMICSVLFYVSNVISQYWSNCSHHSRTMEQKQIFQVPHDSNSGQSIDSIDRHHM